MQQHSLMPTAFLPVSRWDATFSRVKRSFALAAGLLAAVGSAQAQTVPSYSFSQSVGTYTPITGGTVVATASSTGDDLDATVFDNLPIGFTFRFSGANYTTFALSTNGFITFGTTPPDVFDPPISSTTGYDGAVAPLGTDLVGNTTTATGAAGQIRYQVLGGSPARTLVVQFSNFQPFGQTASLLNFQIRLNESSNVVDLAYGLFQTQASLNVGAEVGLRGSDNTSFSNRTTMTDWTQTTPGSFSNATMPLTNTVKPPLGLVYTFSPPNSCPSLRQLGVNSITDNSATITFTAATPAPAGGYTVTTSPASGGGGQAVSSSPFTLTGLMAGTTYTASLVSNCSGGVTSVPATVTFTTVATCTAPTGVAVSNIGITTASVSFTAGNNNTSYVVNAVPAAGGNGTVTASGTASPINLAGLTGGVRYNVTVTGSCSGGGSFTSSPAISFVTLPANDNPSGAIALAIGASCSPTNAANVGATTTTPNGYTNPGSCGTAANPKDVWFAFTTPATGAAATGVRINVSGTAAGTVRAFSTAGGASGPFTEVGCSAGSGINTQAPALNLNGLTPGATYYVAVSGFGSNDTQGTFTICVTNPGNCGIPTNVAASGITTTGANIGFTAASGANTYTVTYTPAGGATQTASGTAPPIALSGLTANTTYSVTVTSNCAVGTATSAPISFMTTSPTCVAPSNVAANNVTSNSASIAFTAGSGGSSYTVTYTPTGGAAQVASGGGSPIALTGLTPSTGYTVRVTSNCTGSTATSNAVAFTTSPPCTAPANVAANSVTVNSASISFTGSSGASTYTVTYTPAGGTAQTTSGNGSPIALTGLTPSTSYSATVTSNCGGGQTVASTAITFTTATPPCTAPGSVAANSVTTTSASISFTAGTNATTYTVTYTAAGGTAQTTSGNASPIALSGLTASTTYSVTVTSNCGAGQTAASAPISFTTQTPAPPCTAPSNVAANSVTANSTSIAFTAGTGAASYTVTYTPAGGAAQTASGPASPIALSGLTSNTSYSVSVTSNCGSGQTAASAPITFTTQAAAPGNLTVASGQSMTASGAYHNITVQSGGTLTLTGATTFDGAVSIQGTLITNCNTLGGTGSFALAASGELQICDPTGISSSGTSGAIQNTGTRIFSGEASYVYDGTVAQVTGTGLPARIRSLTVNNANDLTLSQALGIRQLARLQSGDLNTNGLAFTLVSTPGQGTAVLDNTGGIVNGTGTMQRAIDNNNAAGIGYRHYSSPVNNTTIGDLAATGFAPVLNAGYNNSPTASLVNPFPTVFGYDQNRIATATSSYTGFDKGWFSPAALTDAMVPNRGYTANVANGVLVDFRGTFNNGTQTVGPLTRGTDANAGYHLLGNPYPAPLDWSTVGTAQRPGLDAALYVFQSTGQYTGTYRTFLPGVSNPATVSPLVDAGQGYFVRVSSSATPGTVNLTNTNRITTFGPQPAFGRGTATPAMLQLQVASATQADDAFVYFDATASAGFDATQDAAKLPNPSGLTLASLAGTEPVAINGLPLPGSGETLVPLRLTVPAAGTYTFRVQSLPTTSGQLYLRDTQTGTQTLLSAGTTYAAQLATGSTGRFVLVHRAAGALANQAGLTAAQVSVFPNPAHGQFTLLLPPVAGQKEVQATLLNALGQAIATRTIALTAAGASVEYSTTGLATGVYMLRLEAGGPAIVRRVVVQ